MTGWITCVPIQFGTKDHRIEVRGKFDREHIYLRWQVDLAEPFEPSEVEDLKQLFFSQACPNSLSFYFQGDPGAEPSTKDGRDGDVRFVFAMIKNQQGMPEPVAIGMYPKWHGESGKATQMSYKSGSDNIKFEHVGPIEGIQLAHRVQKEGKRLVITAAIPVSAIPLKARLTPKLRTLVNFSATTDGTEIHWWADMGGLANARTKDQTAEARIYPAAWSSAKFAF